MGMQATRRIEEEGENYDGEGNHSLTHSLIHTATHPPNAVGECECREHPVLLHAVIHDGELGGVGASHRSGVFEALFAHAAIPSGDGDGLCLASGLGFGFKVRV